MKCTTAMIAASRAHRPITMLTLPQNQQMNEPQKATLIPNEIVSASSAIRLEGRYETLRSLDCSGFVVSSDMPFTLHALGRPSAPIDDTAGQVGRRLFSGKVDDGHDALLQECSALRPSPALPIQSWLGRRSRMGHRNHREFVACAERPKKLRAARSVSVLTTASPIQQYAVAVAVLYDSNNGRGELRENIAESRVPNSRNRRSKSPNTTRPGRTRSSRP